MLQIIFVIPTFKVQAKLIFDKNPAVVNQCVRAELLST